MKGVIKMKKETSNLMISRSERKLVPIALAMALLFFAALPSLGQGTNQRSFASPDEAMQALADAAKNKDRAALGSLFGPEYQKLLSGDPVQDNNELDHFAAAIGQSAKLRKTGDSRAAVTIGPDNWPFPIPIVKSAQSQTGDQWRFDTAAGMEEILNRRIGENELSAISTCRAYTLAQWEYFTEGDHDNDGVAEYAQKFISTPGQKDGLFWETAEGEKPSPMGALVAAARAEGYAAGRRDTATVKAASATTSATTSTNALPRSPYHGYYFRILKRQGQHAPGGKYNYVINGNMIAGYALIAFPEKWGSSGIMTFIVNQQGRVYQRNFGSNTLKIANAITEYDPDPGGWKVVKE